MNLNHDPDKHLLDQIDKLLKTHQPTGDKVLDELATSRPTPRPDFQNTLEQRLLARFEQIEQGETPMAASTSYMPISAPRRNWLPLTLLAALVVVAIAGVMLINGRGKTPTINEVSLAQASTTPMPTPTIAPATQTQSVSMTTAVPPFSNANLSTLLPPNSVAISVPLQQLTQDSLIPGVGGGVDIVVILPFKVSNPNLDVIPATAMPDGSRAVEMTLVRDATVLFHTPISQSNPPDASASITFAVSVEDSRQLAWMGEQPQVRIRLQKPVEHSISADSGILLLPFEFVTADESIQTGDIVNIISTCAFVPDAIGNDVTASKTDCSQSSNQIRALNAQIMSGEILANDQSSVKTSNALSLVVPQDSLPMFAQMINGRMHFKLVKSTTASLPTPILEVQSVSTAAPEPVTPTSDAEKILMTIPRSDFIEVGPNVREGEPADIVFSFFYLSRPDNSPTAPLKPSSQIRPVATKVDIIKIGGQNKDDEITLSVTRQQSVIIQWALDTKLALSLSQIVFDIPLSLIDSSPDSIQVGDLVDVYATCLLVANTPSSKVDCTRAVEQKDFVGTVVLLNDSLDQNRTPAVVTVSVALPPLPPDIQLRLSSMVAAGMHFKLVKSGVINQPTPTPVPQATLVSGKVNVDIPLADITFITLTNQQAANGVGYNKGDLVSIISTVLVLGTNNVDHLTPEATQAVTPAGTEVPGQLTKVAVQAALITNVTSDVMTVMVTPDEATTIQQLLDAKLPLKMRPVLPVLATAPSSNTMTLTLDSIYRWSTDKLEVGDQVDMVIGMVEGEGTPLNLSFQPYEVYNWIDPFSNGAFNAQTYIPDPATKQKGSFFLRGLLRNATISAIEQQTDAKSGRIKSIKLTLDLSTNTTAAEALRGYIDAGLPYLVIKHESTN